MMFFGFLFLYGDGAETSKARPKPREQAWLEKPIYNAKILWSSFSSYLTM